MSNELTARIDTLIHAPVSKVWEALTTPSMIKQYLFGTDTTTDWKPGSPITFEGEYNGQNYKDKGIIKDFEPGRLLRYTYWSSMSGKEDIPENYNNVSYELREESGGTRVTIIQDKIPDEKTQAHMEENWGMVLKGMKELLEN